jgi:biopolymer transport protein ExbB
MLSRLEQLIIHSLEFLNAGGAVMWPLLILSICMWWLICSKGLELLTWRRREQPVQALVQGKRRGAEWQEAILDLLRTLPDQAGPLDGRALKKLTRGLDARIDRSLQTILLLAGAAPLLGLLGTVCGMIATFEVIAGFGTGNARAMAAGISEALISTQTGLLVAVPGLVIGSLMIKKAQEIKNRMHRFALLLVRELKASSTQSIEEKTNGQSPLQP